MTRHGWRVAYHLARSVKTRRLELPATLPLCLYPPGEVKPKVQGEEARAESSRGEGEHGAVTAGDLDGAQKGQGKGSALANMDAEHRGAAASSAAGPPTGGRKGIKKKMQTKKGKANDNSKEGEARKGGVEEHSAAYRMSDRERARYDKTFNKLLKGSSGKNVGGKEVGMAMRALTLRGRFIRW